MQSEAQESSTEHFTGPTRISLLKSLSSSQPHEPLGILKLPKAPAKNTEQRWSLSFDTSSRLLNDSLGQIEYIKGIGPRAVPDYHEQRDAGQSLRTFDLGDHLFAIQSISTASRFALTELISWKTMVDSFQVTLKEDDIINIPACDITEVYYNIEQRKCAFDSRPQNIGVHPRPNTILLQIGGDEIGFFRLRSLLEKRFGAMKVRKTDAIWFTEREHQLEQSRLCTLPPLSAGVIGVDALDPLDELSESFSKEGNSNKRIRDASESLEEFEALVTNRGMSPFVENFVQTTEQGDIRGHQKTTVLNVTHISLPQQVCNDETTQLDLLDIRTASDIISKKDFQNLDTSAYNSRKSNDEFNGLGKLESSQLLRDKLANSKSSEDGPQQHLRYQSGEIIRQHDLVVRLRDSLDIQHGRNKLDHLDVYDGPFKIVELPSSLNVTIDMYSSDSDDNNSKSYYESPHSKSPLDTRRLEELIKLDFPPDTKAEPWTELGRLRPVYKINPNIAPTPDARLTYYYVSKINNERTIVNTEEIPDTDEDNEDDMVEGVVKIRSGVYAKVKYVAAEGPEDTDSYEVEKLRGKQVYRYDRSEYADERMDDDRIRRYLEEEGGIVGDNEVLVVKYLIHVGFRAKFFTWMGLKFVQWAGWPSEDDSWERGQGNIPQEFVDAWNANEAAKREVDNAEDETFSPEGRLKVTNGHPKSAKKRRVSSRIARKVVLIQ